MASDLRLKEQLPNLTRKIVETYATVPGISHLGHCPLPNYDEIIAATSLVHRAPLVTRDARMLGSRLVPLAIQ